MVRRGPIDAPIPSRVGGGATTSPADATHVQDSSQDDREAYDGGGLRCVPHGRRALRVTAVLVIVAGTGFLLLTTVGMLIYPGGNEIDPAAEGYSLCLNFLSDLGATRSYGGEENLPALVLFVAGLGSAGLVLLSFGCATPQLCRSGPVERWVMLPAAAFGLVAGASFVGIAATPWDVALRAHLLFVASAYLAAALFTVCLLILQTLQSWSPAYWIANLVYLAILVAYAVLVYVQPADDATGALMVEVVGQKVVVYASVLNLSWQAVGVLRRPGPASG